MLILLLGQDLFLKQEFLQSLLKNNKAVAKRIHSIDELPGSSTLGQQSFFDDKEILVLENLVSVISLDWFTEASKKEAIVVLWQDGLDKRLKDTKLLFGLAETHEFPLPSKEQASVWIKTYAQKLHLQIENAAANLLVQKLCGDVLTELPVLKTHQELLKLGSFAQGEIKVNHVEDLVMNILPIDIFKLTNALAAKNKSLAASLLLEYFTTEPDEKTAAIKLVALWSEQLRAALIVQDLIAAGFADQKILDQTGWKSGRLFMVKKTSQGFNKDLLVSTLGKLVNLDIELKTSTTPPGVIVDLILAAF